MADLSLKYLLFGEDKTASKTIKGVGDAAEKQSSKLSKLGKVATVGLGAALGGIGVLAKVGFDETKDAQHATAQLAAGIKSTGGAAGVTVDQLNDLAGSIQGYSGQTDDSIAQSENLLLTFTNIKNAAGENNDVFTQATKLTADMAAKMGNDAASNAVLLGKALNDPVKNLGALTRVGVSFTDQQTEQIKALSKSGKTMDAQKIILKELNKEFGGAAKAAGDALPGQIERAKRSFEDVSQELVTDLLPVITQLMNFILHTGIPALHSLTQFWMEHKTTLMIIAGVIATVVVAVRTISAVTKAWAVVQAALNVVMAANPVVLITLAIVALIAIIVVIATKTDWFQKLWHAAWGAISGAVQSVWNWIKANWPLILGILLGPVGIAVVAISKNWDKIKKAFSTLKDDIAKIASSMWSPIVDAFKFVMNKIADVWNATVGGIGFKAPKWVPHFGGKGFSIPNMPHFYAAGTSNIGQGAFVVGENGPEMGFRSGNKVSLMSNRDSAKFAPAQPRTIIIPVQINGREIARIVHEEDARTGAYR